MPETTVRSDGAPAARRGRPPRTSSGELEAVALRLFTEHGFEGTTVDMIAAAAGTSRRTFFRYFDSKAGVLWRDFDVEVTKIRETLDAMPPELPVMDAVRRAVLAVNHYGVDDVDGLRARMALVGSTPDLAASAALHYDAWERAVGDFVARRQGLPPDSLYPLAVGRATLAACRAAYDRWVSRADAELTVYLDAALQALSAGFADDVLVAEPRPARRRSASAARRRPSR